MTHVRNTDHDGVEPIETHLRHSDVHIPRSGKARCRIEQVLAVMHVDDGKTVALQSNIRPVVR